MHINHDVALIYGDGAADRQLEVQHINYGIVDPRLAIPNVPTYTDAQREAIMRRQLDLVSWGLELNASLSNLPEVATKDDLVPLSDYGRESLTAQKARIIEVAARLGLRGTSLAESAIPKE